ncbi:hypothetical protein SAMN05428995_103242 [Loktanella sp. DSM 29012]|uniref:DNA polymerase III subunit chi n=1 Tax=Loktanella gaetbuli TaxID=2881335 RepID=A0ABS8BQH3_9RHOB|nr:MULTISPECIES: DNA polymerase III subunit chi [Loktanella]MCB5197979.1 DNA polymerase III subunit chi [Loktanella gaetbuli]SEQ21466.1 hypothetical protein SAMN05428995_103242 [Loktanella sp. DSM 29012]
MRLFLPLTLLICLAACAPQPELPEDFDATFAF